MKKQFPFAIGLILVLASICLAQETTPAPKPAPKRAAMGKADIQRNLIATEKKLWEAWKNKDVKPFKSMLSADSISVTEMGVEGKEAAIKSIGGSDCEVRSYELADFKVTKFNTDAAMITYKASQDATCSGKTLPPTVWASSLYVRRGGKWYAASHQETAATP